MKFASKPKVLALAGGFLALAAAAPAYADEPSANAIAMATQVINDVGMRAGVENIIPLTLGEMQRNVAAIHPEMATALKEASVTIIPEFAKSGDKVIADLAHVMASRMSEQELRDSLAFFEGPSGKKYLATQPILLQEFQVSTGIWRSELNKNLLSRLREEMKKKGVDF